MAHTVWDARTHTLQNKLAREGTQRAGFSHSLNPHVESLQPRTRKQLDLLHSNERRERKREKASTNTYVHTVYSRQQ